MPFVLNAMILSGLWILAAWSLLITAIADSYKPLELTYWRTLSIVASLLGRDITAGAVTWLLPCHRMCLQRCLATRSRLDWFGFPRLASALLGTVRRIQRFVYDCVIAERVSMLQALYGVNTPHYIDPSFLELCTSWGNYSYYKILNDEF
jgi:hypothetical protein